MRCCRYFFSCPSRISQSGYRFRSLYFASSMSFASMTMLPTMPPDFVLILNTNRFRSPASAADKGSRDRHDRKEHATFHSDTSSFFIAAHAFSRSSCAARQSAYSRAFHRSRTNVSPFQ